MHSGKLLLLMLAALAVGLVGCAGAPSVAVTTPVPDLPTLAATVPPAAGALTAPAQVLMNTDNGKTISLKVGQVVSIQLRDRQWAPPAVDTSVLQTQVLNMALPQGLYRWDYKAISPGTTTLVSDGACLSTPGQPSCMSIIVYKVTINVTQ